MSVQRRWGTVVLALVALGGLVLWSSTTGSPKTVEPSVPKSEEAERTSVEASGELRSTDSFVVGCPPIPRMWEFTVTFLADEGTEVAEGQPVLGLDTRTLVERLDVKRSELDTARKELEKTRLEQAEKLDALRLELAELKAKKARLDRKLGVPASLQGRIELEKTRLDRTLAVEEIRIMEERIRLQTLAKSSLIERAEGRVEILTLEIESLESNIEAMTRLAPRAGFVVHAPDWNGEKVRVGESVWSGRSILEIADLSSMEVIAEVPEPSAGSVEEGQSVEIRLDAAPDQLFTGRVKSLGRLVRTKSYDTPTMIFDAVLSIDEEDPELMRPGMKATVNILTRGEELDAE